MSWSTAADLKAQVLRLWERGELLRSAVTGETRFPLRLTLKGPGSAEIAERFDAVRSWLAALQAIAPIRIEWREVQHRVHGAQRLPQSVWIDEADAALGWIGKRREAAQFDAVLAATRSAEPALLPWLTKRPLHAVELGDDWPRLLAVVGWLRDHPRPGIHLRQVDVPGVHSKFIEAHRGVLAELLDLALPADAIAADQTGTSRFAARYGFLDKPVRIRLRALDPALRLLDGPNCPDLTLDAESFAALAVPIRQVFITENETNFLAFPPAPQAIVIFGAGYGFDALARADWLHQTDVHYWGDIDTHGFAILDQLRRLLPHTRSFLMDHETLLAHETHWGEEPTPTTADLPNLTNPESRLYDELRDNRIREHLRLEQERIGFGWVEGAVGKLRKPNGASL